MKMTVLIEKKESWYELCHGSNIGDGILDRYSRVFRKVMLSRVKKDYDMKADKDLTASSNVAYVPITPIYMFPSGFSPGSTMA